MVFSTYSRATRIWLLMSWSSSGKSTRRCALTSSTSSGSAVGAVARTRVGTASAPLGDSSWVGPGDPLPGRRAARQGGKAGHGSARLSAAAAGLCGGVLDVVLDPLRGLPEVLAVGGEQRMAGAHPRLVLDAGEGLAVELAGERLGRHVDALLAHGSSSNWGGCSRTQSSSSSTTSPTRRTCSWPAASRC